MKKVLLATTMLVAGASVAVAEVTVSGEARMGVVSNGFDNITTLNTDESEPVFTSRARVTFTLSEETDTGLSFGASFRADNAGDASNGLAGSVFVSGAFGELRMGDINGAAQMATGNVQSTSLTGLGDVADATFIGAGGLNITNPRILAAQGIFAGVNQTNPNDTQDPTLRYTYTAGAFTGYFSLTNSADSLVNTAPQGAPAANNALASNAQAMAIGARYTFGDYYIGVGYEKVDGFIAPNAAGAVGPGARPVDNTDLKHAILAVGGEVAGFTFRGLYGKASGTYAGANVVTAATSGKQYAASASYTMSGVTGTVFYTDDSGMPGAGATVAYGVGASYDLGGGASLRGGIAKTKVAGPADNTAFDFGINMSF